MDTFRKIDSFSMIKYIKLFLRYIFLVKGKQMSVIFHTPHSPFCNYIPVNVTATISRGTRNISAFFLDMASNCYIILYIYCKFHRVE